MPPAEILLTALAAAGAGPAGWRLLARSRRRYVRLLVEPYRGDRAGAEGLLATMAGLQALAAVRGPGRLVGGQPSLSLEVHLHVRAGGAPLAWLAICVPEGLERQAQAVLRTSYPNCALRPLAGAVGFGGTIVRLHKRRLYPEPVRRLGEIDPDRPPVERLLRAMAAAGGPAAVQIALTPAPAVLGWARPRTGMRSEGDSDTDFSEQSTRARGPYFYADIRVIGHGRRQLAAIAAELRAGGATNRLVGRQVGPVRGRALRRRAARGEGNPMPAPLRHSYAAEEIAGLWQLPSVGFAAVPFGRRAVPLAPAPAGIMRVDGRRGLLGDGHGRVSIHRELRRQNTAVVGTVEQGKTSYLVASVREDVGREDCAVIVLDPKGDAADAAVSVVPAGRECTVLDLARPTCGFNPLGVQAPIDAIADYVVAALRQLFADGEVRGSSDRYLRNALIAVLAYDRRASLWDVARLLEVGPAGVALRARVGHRLAALPEFAEVAGFLAEELPGQLADARASTTAKLDAPANKLARVLNSTSVKRVLLNRSLTIDFDRLIAERGVLIVRGALGEMGAGNVSVLMQLLVGMLDAALSRAQDRRGSEPATAVALKIDEAPLVINRAFAETMALKRSAGLETVACWQTDAQWAPELRNQLDALFAHRVLFATASAEDARAAAGLLMAEFSDQLRTGDQAAASLAAPDVRLHLPRHTAIVSWVTPQGRERPFIGRTLRLSVDRARLADQSAAQRERGGRELESLAPPPRVDQMPPGSDPPPVSKADPVDSGERAGERGTATSAEDRPEAPASVDRAEPTVESAAASYLELWAVDAARAVRWLPVPPGVRRPALAPAEVELLAWIAAAGCALSSQVHRRMGDGRALTTTQRRLKRLADAGLIARFQLHGGDGGGVPFCCSIAPAGLALLELDGRSAPVVDESTLERLRRDIHTVGWLLALEANAGVLNVLGPGRARLAPGSGADAGLVGLPAGVHARDFLTGDPDAGPRRPVERFRPLTPAAVAEVTWVPATATTDLLVFHAPDDRTQAVALVERLDHLIAGWWRSVPRYARRGQPPAAVVVCADDCRARALADRADRVLTACLARIGQAPDEWEYPGRRGVAFVAERDVHDGRLIGWQVPAVAPSLRVGTAGGVRTDPVLALPSRVPGRPLPRWR